MHKIWRDYFSTHVVPSVCTVRKLTLTPVYYDAAAAADVSASRTALFTVEGGPYPCLSPLKPIWIEYPELCDDVDMLVSTMAGNLHGISHNWVFVDTRCEGGGRTRADLVSKIFVHT